MKVPGSGGSPMLQGDPGTGGYPVLYQGIVRP